MIVHSHENKLHKEMYLQMYGRAPNKAKKLVQCDAMVNYA